MLYHKYSLGCPQAMCNDDLRKMDGRRWMREAEEQTKWLAIGKAYA